MSLESRIKALEEKVETMDMLTQSLKSELKKALEDIDELNAAYDIKLMKDGLGFGTTKEGLSDL
jgi:chromosome segregation ATPase